MMNTRIDFRFAAVIALAVVGCKGGEYAKAQEDFANKTCECKDAACLTTVTKEQAEWLQKNAASATASASDAEKIAASTKKMTECATKIATAAAGH